jgi:hypothetical protein
MEFNRSTMAQSDAKALEQAKATLIRSAADLCPMSPIRESPWLALVGAAAFGVALGTGAKRCNGLMRLGSSIANIARSPALSLLNQMLAQRRLNKSNEC